ncbi:MAG: DUF2911 domain-containing protein [Blastocatellia bacterium]|nr:DUF2911 domain-containing protein [Blastocatellia bacterium]
MKHKIAATLLTFCMAVAAHAQQGPKIVAFGSDSPERGTTRVAYWDNVKKAVIAEFAINYGRPAWKKDYEDQAKFDTMTKGKVWRLGENFWTLLDTNIPLKIADKDVPVGLWYLGLHRSDDGATWSLVFIDPVKARNSHLDAFQIGQAPIEFKVPMKAEQPGEIKEKLTIDLIYKQENLKEVTLKIAWGKLQVTAPIQVPIKG